ncbi:MAG TPA: helix-turn-helix transcriptional regulator [Streptosporangiaceae bacterium]|jgi:transcriptional regulator with XRE-family HTH domain
MTYPRNGPGAEWPARSRPGDLARRIAARREELGLTRETVARRAGMGPGYLGHLEEHATMPTWETLRRVAAALETTPGVLLGEAASSCPEP